MWTVRLKAAARKQVERLPEKVNKSFKALLADLQTYGPVLPSWPNFAKLKQHRDCYHCHLKKARPTYVAVWQVIERQTWLNEVRYVGVHESAD